MVLDSRLVRGLSDSLGLCLSSGSQAADLPGRTWRSLAESPELGRDYGGRGQENRRPLPTVWLRFGFLGAQDGV